MQVKYFSLIPNVELWKKDYYRLLKKKLTKDIIIITSIVILLIIIKLLIASFVDQPQLNIFFNWLIIAIILFDFFKLERFFSLKDYVNKLYVNNNSHFKPLTIEIHDYQIKLIQNHQTIDVLLLSQIEKVLLLSESIYFIEKNKKLLPFRINKKEMSPNTFGSLINELKAINLDVNSKIKFRPFNLY